MAVLVHLLAGTTPQGLLAAIRQQIQDGKIDTWEFHTATGFVHQTHDQQWNKGAYLAEINGDKKQVLRLYYLIEEGKAAAINSKTYGTLNGRFAGMLLNHFSAQIERLELKDLRKKNSST